jgi:hypothetical protein
MRPLRLPEEALVKRLRRRQASPTRGYMATTDPGKGYDRSRLLAFSSDARELPFQALKVFPPMSPQENDQPDVSDIQPDDHVALDRVKRTWLTPKVISSSSSKRAEKHGGTSDYSTGHILGPS